MIKKKVNYISKQPLTSVGGIKRSNNKYGALLNAAK
jgi:hypothetical protein